MLNYFIGQSTFRTGITVIYFIYFLKLTISLNIPNIFQNYLKKYQFSNAEQNELWIELDKVSIAL